MKKCARCKETKDESKFARHKSEKDGLQRWCRACRKAYSQSAAGKEAFRKYTQTDKYKETKRQYNRSDAGKKAQRKHAKTDKRKASMRAHRQTDKGKRAHHRASRRYRAMYPERGSAHAAVRKAVRHGNLMPVAECPCADCGDMAREYHHPNYDMPLDVIPLCHKCHVAIHN